MDLISKNKVINTFEYTRVNNLNINKKELEKFLQNNWDSRLILYNDNNLSKKQQFIDFDHRGNDFKTKNYIGTIVYDNVNINIFPKLYRDSLSSKLNISDVYKNISYWLEFCSREKFPFLSTSLDVSSNQNFLELLINIYANYTLSLVSKYHFHQYEIVEEDLDNIKGRINIRDYFTKKVVNGNFNSFKCSYSDFRYDNLLNRIIKYTCIFLTTLTNNSNCIRVLRRIITQLNDVENVKVHASDCDKIKVNSYYFEYNLVISMSKMFLLNKSNNEMERTSNINTFCFLFPAEDLYEEFVAGFLKSKFFENSLDNGNSVIFTQGNGKAVKDRFLVDLYIDNLPVNKGRSFLQKEDIYIFHHGNVFVLDTKYKIINSLNEIVQGNTNVAEDDIRQILIYGIKNKAKKVFLVYPLNHNEEYFSNDINYKVNIDNVDLEIGILKIPFLRTENSENILENIFKKLVFYN